MFGAFRRPVGAAADVRELEYVSALHQTSLPHVRADATVSAADIQLFLRSRYGICISDDVVIDIVRGLGGVRQRTSGTAENSDDDYDEEAVLVKPPTDERARGVSLTGHVAGTTTKLNLSSIKESIQKIQERQSSAAVRSMKQNWAFHRPHIPLKKPISAPQIKGRQNPLTRFCRKRNSESSPFMEDVDGEFLDLVQIVSTLLIPPLLRAKREMFTLHRGAGKLDLRENTRGTSCMNRMKEFLSNPCGKCRRNRESKERELKEALQTQPPTIVEDVLRIMLASLRDEDADGGGSPRGVAEKHPGIHRKTSEDTERRSRDPLPPLRRVTVDAIVVRKLLEASGELDAAADDDLVDDMVDAAGGVGATLDASTFSTALTADVGRWNVGCEDNISSSFFDVFGFEVVKCNKYAASSHPSFDELATRQVSTKKIPPFERASLEHVGIVGDSLERNGKVREESSKSRQNNHVKRDVAREATAKRIGAVGGNIEDDEVDSLSFVSANSSLDEEIDEPDAIGQTTVDAGLDRSVVIRWEEFDHHGSSGTTSMRQRKRRNDPNRRVPQGAKLPKYIPTMPYIDYAADTTRSVTFNIYVFLLFIVLCTGLIYIGDSVEVFNAYQCSPENSNFGCKLIDTVLGWLKFAISLSVGGLLVIVPISFGGHPYNNSCARVSFSIAVLFFYTLGPFLGLQHYRDGIPHSDDGKLTETEKRVQSHQLGWLAYGYLGAGSLLLYKLLLNLLSNALPQKAIKRNSILRRFLMPSIMLRTTDMKIASTIKLNKMMENACKLHRGAQRGSKGREAEQETMLNFVLNGETLEECGGLLWTWKRLFTGDLFRREGIWLHDRLAIGQVAQACTFIFIMALWFYGTVAAADGAQKQRDKLEDDGSSLAEWALQYVPETWMIYGSFIPGGFVAVLVSVLLMLLHMPNTVTTIMKLRCGVIPSFNDPEFFQYRLTPDTIFYNVGNQVYALLGSAVLFFLLIGGMLFLLFYPPTRDFMIFLAAWGIGLQITILLKMILMMWCRSSYFKALYRKKPGAANLSSLAMECWHLGLGGGVMLGRLTQFLLAAAFWIGRIDQAFLSEEVNLLGYRFDLVPINYRKELLVHDAHRHPFMERLAAMYLMRLRWGEGFCNDAGAAWRRLFVLTLMPWLLKYRQGNEPDGGDDFDDLNFLLGIKPMEELPPVDPREEKGMTELFYGMVADKVVSTAHLAVDGVRDATSGDSVEERTEVVELDGEEGKKIA